MVAPGFDRGTFEVQRSALVQHGRRPRQGRRGALGLDQEGTAHGRLPTGLALRGTSGEVDAEFAAVVLSILCDAHTQDLFLIFFSSIALNGSLQCQPSAVFYTQRKLQKVNRFRNWGPQFVGLLNLCFIFLVSWSPNPKVGLPAFPPREPQGWTLHRRLCVGRPSNRPPCRTRAPFDRSAERNAWLWRRGCVDQKYWCDFNMFLITGIMMNCGFTTFFWHHH